VVRAVASVGSRLGVAVKVTGVRDAAEIEAVIDDAAIAPNGGLIVLPTSITNAHRALIIARAAGHRLPAAYAYRHFVSSGGLLSYGSDHADLYRRPPDTWIASSRVRSQKIFPYSCRPSSS
jgi:putative tryptophan/tyrosine transport system substrate-binding protein